MNQILQMPVNSIYNKNRNTKYSIFFKIYFLCSIVIMLSSFIYYINKMNNIDKNEQLSRLLMNNYNISRLSSTSNNVTSINLSNGNNFSVIGILQIDKINLKYPVLSNISDYLLQIAPCKFYGPDFDEPRKYMYCFS